MSDNLRVITGSVVNVFISSTITSFGSEKRFKKDLTIAALKEKLELITGGSASSMQLELYDKESKLVCRLSDDEALLGSYNVDDGMRIHVIDSSGKAGQFEDVSKVEKFEITQEDYEKRTDSVRAFKERMKLGRFAEIDPEEKQRQDEERLKKEKDEEQAANSIQVGSRCEVRVTEQPVRRGTVMYVGKTDFKSGYWVGVKYDEPLGKNDGSVGGRRYFTCPPKYGGFVKVSQITVGDFPEEDMDLDDEM